MNIPKWIDYDTSLQFYIALSDYWSCRYDCAKAVGDECLEALVELDEVYYDDEGLPCWVHTGDLVGGA